MNRLLACVLSALFLLLGRMGVAADYYDGQTLTVPMVTVNGKTYTNAKVTIAKIGTVQMGNPLGNFDTYSNGSLFIPSAYYNGHQYTNVTVTVASVLQCCGVTVPAAYLLVVNPNDQTIGAYPYMNASATPETVTDPALANASSSESPKLYLDKANNLVFDVVNLASGGYMVTPFSFNASTGALATAGPAASYPSALHVIMDPGLHLVLVVTNGGQTITYYPYNPQTGAIGSVELGSVTNVLVASIFDLDYVNSLAFTLTSSGVTSFPVQSAGVVFIAAAPTLPSNLLSLAGSAQKLDTRLDPVNRVLLTDVSVGTGLQVQAIPYGSKTLGPAGTVVTQSTGGGSCSVDPNHLLFFVSGNNSALMTAYSYTAVGGLSQGVSTDLSQNNLGGAYYPSGGCYDVDPDNQIMFLSASNPFGVDMFLYDSQGNVNPIPAQHISLTGGSKQLNMISSRSYKHD